MLCFTLYIFYIIIRDSDTMRPTRYSCISTHHVDLLFFTKRAEKVFMTRFAIANLTINELLANQVLELSIFLLELVYIEGWLPEDRLHSIQLL